MKKILSLILTAVLLTAALTVFSNANDYFTECVGVVNVGLSSPSVDGEISDSDGWSNPVHVDRTKYGTAWSSESDFRTEYDLYIAYDENGLYFAADIKDDFTLQDGYGKTIKNGTVISSENYTYDDDGMVFDGDDFIFMLDMQNFLARSGYTSNRDFTAWYNVGLTGGGAKMLRSRFNEGEIEGAKVSGHTTDDGWLFEAFIPWTEISKDCSAASDGEFAPTAKELATAATGNMFADGFADRSNDNTFTAAEVIYVDRYTDESGSVQTWQRYCTVAASVRGDRGEGSDSVSVACYGIFLRFLDKQSTETTGRLDGFGGDAFMGSGKVDIELAKTLGEVNEKEKPAETEKSDSETDKAPVAPKAETEKATDNTNKKDDREPRVLVLIPIGCIIAALAVVFVIVKKQSKKNTGENKPTKTDNKKDTDGENE